MNGLFLTSSKVYVKGKSLTLSLLKKSAYLGASTHVMSFLVAAWRSSNISKLSLL